MALDAPPLLTRQAELEVLDTDISRMTESILDAEARGLAGLPPRDAEGTAPGSEYTFAGVEYSDPAVDPNSPLWLKSLAEANSYIRDQKAAKDAAPAATRAAWDPCESMTDAQIAYLEEAVVNRPSLIGDMAAYMKLVGPDSNWSLDGANFMQVAAALMDPSGRA